MTDPVARLGWDQALAWRMRRQHLGARVPAVEALAVVARLGGLHAQLMSSAELTLWARVEALDAEAVATALWTDRTLVKTWAMRGTLHLLPAGELPLWIAALGTRIERHYLNRARQKAFGVDRAQALRLIDAVGEALEGRELTREALAAEVARSTGDPELAGKLTESWGSLLKPAAAAGRLCFAPNDGRRVRFTRPDRWLGTWTEPDPEAALAEVTRRFLGAFGPATREDYARWWGTTPASGGRRLAALGDEVVAVEVDGDPAWMLAAHAPEAAGDHPPAAGVRLLPAFDQYVIAATRHAERLLPAGTRERVYRAQGWISPVLLIDGRMAGVWRHERVGDRLRIQVEPFDRLPSPVRRGIDDEAERLAAFLGGRADLTVEQA